MMKFLRIPTEQILTMLHIKALLEKEPWLMRYSPKTATRGSSDRKLHRLPATGRSLFSRRQFLSVSRACFARLSTNWA